MFFLALAILFMSGLSHAFDHGAWDGLVQRNVVLINAGKSSQVNYAGMQAEQKRLNSYLSKLSSVTKKEFGKWPKAERLAFLINAYNAFTVKLILSKYPDIKSIKELGSLFKSPWKNKFFSLLGKKSHLDELEHGIIRAKGAFDEPRVHFVLNCASIGCPMLSNRAFKAKTLNKQLEEGIRRFLSDRSRNYFNLKNGKLAVSKIFKWYKEDFESGHQGYTSLNKVFKKYAVEISHGSKRVKNRLLAGDYQIKYLDYDWRLNDTGKKK